MKETTARRIVPISIVTMIVFGLMALFQIFVITGGYELEAATVKKAAPWAYESFLKLTGEHPDTRPEWIKEKKAVNPEIDMITIGGIRPEDISVTIEDQPLTKKKVVIEPTKPIEEKARVIPVSIPKVEKNEKPGEVVPVG